MSTKHSHSEAFRHMTYIGNEKGKYIKLTIWNSRDGVTPFITYSKEYGISLQHVNWQNDIYAPDYKPKKGDLIWVSHDEESAKQAAEKSYQFHLKRLEKLRTMTAAQIEQKFGYDQLEQLEKWLGDKEKFIKDSIHEMLIGHGEPQPRLLLVEEDWQ